MERAAVGTSRAMLLSLVPNKVGYRRERRVVGVEEFVGIGRPLEDEHKEKSQGWTGDALDWARHSCTRRGDGGGRRERRVDVVTRGSRVSNAYTRSLNDLNIWITAFNFNFNS